MQHAIKLQNIRRMVLENCRTVDLIRLMGPRDSKLRHWPHKCVRGHPKPRHAVIHANPLHVYNRLSVTVITSFTSSQSPQLIINRIDCNFSLKFSTRAAIERRDKIACTYIRVSMCVYYAKNSLDKGSDLAGQIVFGSVFNR